MVEMNSVGKISAMRNLTGGEENAPLVKFRPCMDKNALVGKFQVWKFNRHGI